jgi:hypothetical protein
MRSTRSCRIAANRWSRPPISATAEPVAEGVLVHEHRVGGRNDVAERVRPGAQRLDQVLRS